MKIRWSKILNFILLLFVLVVVSGFQSTFWYQLFGTVPAPMLWLCLVVYISLYRKLYSALFMIYIMSLAIMGFTIIPMKMLLMSLLLVYLILYSIRSRVFWEGPAYYTIMCCVASFSYHIIYFFSSLLVERNPAPIDFLDRFIQLALTPMFCVPMYWILVKIDKMTLDELSTESRGYEL
ncbi:hypothetical protein [Bdellovibrio sp. HCB337]|uniref:hypothetical protein n=1 Tax=Bdellovibrio sp. HCB337 TaxID=3394358 RepID=UPI0039A5361F